jgi:hypothetical protein
MPVHDPEPGALCAGHVIGKQARYGHRPDLAEHKVGGYNSDGKPGHGAERDPG